MNDLTDFSYNGLMAKMAGSEPSDEVHPARFWLLESLLAIQGDLTTESQEKVRQFWYNHAKSIARDSGAGGKVELYMFCLLMDNWDLDDNAYNSQYVGLMYSVLRALVNQPYFNATQNEPIQKIHAEIFEDFISRGVERVDHQLFLDAVQSLPMGGVSELNYIFRTVLEWVTETINLPDIV